MKEIDILNNVKFTDGNGVMHLYPEEEEGKSNLLSFRYFLTGSEANSDDACIPITAFYCVIKENTFSIRDDGVGFYKDLYRLAPPAFISKKSQEEIKGILQLLGYSDKEIEARFKTLSKVIPELREANPQETIISYSGPVDLDDFVCVLRKGQTYVDAFIKVGCWTGDLDVVILSPDIMEGISIEDFFGDREDWGKVLEDDYYDGLEEIDCVIKLRWGYQPYKTVKTITK